MNILQINLQDGWRGGEQQLSYLMLYLQTKNCNQTLVCKQNSLLEKFAIENKITFFSLNIKGINKLSNIRKIFKLLQKKNINIIHSHESIGLGICIALKIFYKYPFKLILHRRVSFPIKGWFSKHIKYSDKYIDKTICISNEVEKVMNTTASNKKTIVIHSMTDLHFDYTNKNILCKQYNIDTNKTIVGYIAALTFEKDHFTFLNCAKEIIKKIPIVHFVIAGSGKLESELKTYCTNLGLDSYVTFLGYVPQAKNIIPEIDLLLFTSTNEGFGSTIIDFFVAKKPVVAVDNGGCRDTVLHKKTGLLCKQKDIDNLVKYSIELLTNESLCEDITQNAYQFTVEHFSVEAVTAKIHKVYKEII